MNTAADPTPHDPGITSEEHPPTVPPETEFDQQGEYTDVDSDSIHEAHPVLAHTEESGEHGQNHGGEEEEGEYTDSDVPD